jgi:hypothetical protein
MFTVVICRMVYAFSRDGALPFSHVWYKVNKYDVPMNAVWLSCFIAFIMVLPVSVPWSMSLHNSFDWLFDSYKPTSSMMQHSISARWLAHPQHFWSLYEHPIHISTWRFSKLLNDHTGPHKVCWLFASRMFDKLWTHSPISVQRFWWMFLAQPFTIIQL